MKGYRSVCSHSEIDAARMLLWLGETASRGEIRAAYKKLAKERHPDAGGSDGEMKSLNAAYKLLLRYCEDFPISFKKGEVEGQDEYEILIKRFYDDWIG